MLLCLEKGDILFLRGWVSVVINNYLSSKKICVFCKLPRRVYDKKDLSMGDALLSLLITGIFSFTIWGVPTKKSLILFVAMTTLGQIFVRMRWRQSVRCGHCGFDPVVYKREPAQAAEQVTAFIEQRKKDPAFLLRPALDLKPRVEKNDSWRERLLERKGLKQESALKAGAKTPSLDRSREQAGELPDQVQ